MKKIFLLLFIAMSFAAFVSAQSISSFSIITTGSVLSLQKGVSLTQPMYQELVQAKSSGRTIEKITTYHGDISSSLRSRSIQVFPNPFTEMVTVDIKAKIDGKLKLELYNRLGAKVMQDKTFLYSSAPSTQEEIQINLNDLSNGMYFLKTTYIEQNNTKETLIKLIKR